MTKQPKQSERLTMPFDLVAKFSDLEPVLRSLWLEIAEIGPPEKHPQFLAEGRNVRAFELEGGLIVRLPHGATASTGWTRNIHRSKGLVRGRGNEHLEQLVASDVKGLCPITKKMDGIELTKLTNGEIGSVSPDQWTQLVELVLDCYDRAVAIDARPPNLFFDTEKGFGIIDYGPAGTGPKRYHTVGTMLKDVAGTISKAGTFKENPYTQEDFRHSGYLHGQAAAALDAFGEAVEVYAEHFDERDDVPGFIAAHAESSRYRAAQNGDPNEYRLVLENRAIAAVRGTASRPAVPPNIA